LDGPQYVRAGERGQVLIDEADSGYGVADAVECLPTICSQPDELEVRPGLHSAPDSLPENRMIVGNKDGDPFRRHSPA
jgi:hypothetical protein